MSIENVLSDLDEHLGELGHLLAEGPAHRHVQPSAVLQALLTVYSRRKDITYKRRIYTEEKAKVVAASWGAELFQFFAAFAILHQDELKNRLICTLTS